MADNEESMSQEISQAIIANNDRLLSSINALVNEKIGNLKRSIEESADKHADLQLGEIKKLKYGENYLFKRKANEDQYKHNKQTLETFREAQQSLNSDKLDKVADSLETGMEFIHKRQKLILIADKSEFRWKTAQEYIRDDLVDDSEDEKRLWKAELRASKKSREAAIKRKPKKRDFRATTQASTGSAGQSSQTAPRKRGPCFGCGGDHWRVDCPRRQAGNTGQMAFGDNKISQTVSYANVEPGEYISPLVFDGINANLINSKHSDQNDDADSQAEDLIMEYIQHGDNVNVAFSNQNIIFKGRLATNFEFWKSITNSEVVLNIVKVGYRLPLISIPESKFMRNNKSALDHDDFVEASILELLEIGSITECVSAPHIVNPLTVSINGDKKRLILDLRYVNEFLFKHKFKCEDLATVKEILHENDYMFKFDLKSGYHHIEIHEDFHKYLGFSWQFGNKDRFFVFGVLPFGLSTAPYVFTKTLKPLVTKWRGEGKRIVLFLDDGLGLADNFESSQSMSLAVKCDLISAGFVSNEEKSEWFPSQNIIWLGVIIDTVQCKFFVTDKRINKLKSCIDNITEANTWLKVRVLASIAGQIISMALAVGPICSLMTRSIYRCIESRKSWWSFVFVDENVHKELLFWLNNIDRLNGMLIFPNTNFNEIVYADASGTGYGGFVVSNHLMFTRGNWTEEDKSKSSTWRELQAVLIVLLSFMPHLHRCCIKWLSDNQNVVRIVDVGSSKPDLQNIALEIFELCRSREITLNMAWVPRNENKDADELSRIVDDWEINHDTFIYLDKLWGPHSIDRFATWYNAKLLRFNSICRMPGSESADAITQPWMGENNWLVPPPTLISKCISKILNEMCCATLVIPLWVSATFWPLLCTDGIHFNNFIRDWCEICPSKQVILKGRANNTLFGGKDLPFRMLALRCVGKLQDRSNGPSRYFCSGAKFCPWHI